MKAEEDLVKKRRGSPKVEGTRGSEYVSYIHGNIIKKLLIMYN